MQWWKPGLRQPRVKQLLFTNHFTVDSMVPRCLGAASAGGGRDLQGDFHGQKWPNACPDQRSRLGGLKRASRSLRKLKTYLGSVGIRIARRVTVAVRLPLTGARTVKFAFVRPTMGG